TTLLATLVGCALGVQANPMRPAPDEVRDQIRVMEGAIGNSSVTGLYSEQDRAAKQALLRRATEQAELGNYNTAVDLVDQAGRLLYPMERHVTMPLGGDKLVTWLQEMDKVMASVLPAAFGIAEEKGHDGEPLKLAAAQREQGLAAWQAGDLQRAEALMVDAYNRVQAAVVGYRGGDRLVVELPANGTREAWVEAERRFQDWRFMADWMQQGGAGVDVDPEAIAAGNDRADSIYRQASRLAEQQQWQLAVDAIDQAYLVMEEHWRLAGIDI
ncbi:MAG TPA: hypothetical protein VIX81_05860, partial [Gammaproteobacteria bacterium]